LRGSIVWLPDDGFALSIRFGVCTVAGFTIIVEEIAG
jgi:hypothetical protein